MYDYYGDYFMEDFFGDPSIATAIGMIVIVIAIIALIGAAMSLVLYILRSIGLYRMAENRGMSGAGLAWIPFVGSYRVGSVADDIAAREGSRTYFRHLLLAGKIISIVFSSAVSTSMATSFADLFETMGPGGRYYGSSLPGSFMLANSFSSLVSLIGLATFVITIVALNKVYKCYRPAGSTAWTVLSVIFPFMQSIFLFIIRNDMPMPSEGAPWNGQPPQQGGYYPPQDGRWQAPPPQQPGMMGYPPPQQPYQQPYQQPQQPEGSGYYPPRAPEPPVYPPQDFAPGAPDPVPPWEGGKPHDGE